MKTIHWLASYPKSGNTWLRLLLWSLLAGGASVDFSRRSGFAPLAGAIEDLEHEAEALLELGLPLLEH